MEKREIRDIALLIFYNCSVDRSLLKVYQKWSYFFKLFFRIIDRENGNYLHLPTNNPPYDQPVKTMMILDYMRELWIDKLTKEQENNTIR